MTGKMERREIGDRAWVFVACGGEKHFRSLEIALALLKKHSSLPVVLVTDRARNQVQPPPCVVMDTPAPREMTHRQAAIFLKTSLNRILPPGRTYCYLDTDVLAVRPGPDKIFELLGNRPILFAPDHCTLEMFSPRAVRCGCARAYEEREERFNRLMEKHMGPPLADPVLADRKNRLERLILEFKKNQIISTLELSRKRSRLDLLNQNIQKRKRSAPQGILPSLAGRVADWFKPSPRTLFEREGFYWDAKSHRCSDRDGNVLFDREFHDLDHFFRTNGGYTFDWQKRRWYDWEGNLLFDDLRWREFVRALEKAHGYARGPGTGQWLDPAGNPVFDCQCGHLAQALGEKFGVPEPEGSWVHPNGGVFVFSDRAGTFLDTWHAFSLAALQDPYFEDRDQGALAAAMGKHHLEKMEYLPRRYNFIADPMDTNLIHAGGLEFSTPGEPGRALRPILLHVYHGFEDPGWEVWREVAARIPRFHGSAASEPGPG